MTLSESLEHYESQASTSPPRDVAVRRAYMAGALDALTSKAPRESMLAEIVQFGRAVGREVTDSHHHATKEHA